MVKSRESSEGTKNDDAVKLKKFRKDLRWCRRNCAAHIYELVNKSDNPEMYQEEEWRCNQAKLGKLLNYRTARRLEEGQLSYTDDYREWTKGSISEQKYTSEIMKLTDVALRYSVREQLIKTDGGTLEAHESGFGYTISSSIFKMEFSYNNIKHVFFRYEHEEMLPLLHFHLYDPIKVAGTEETKDIQFQLVNTILGPKGSADHSCKIEKEEDYNENFQKFVEKIRTRWDRHILTIESSLKCYEFHGSPGVVALTTSCLAAIVEAPFFVVTLGEIEFVNLAYLRSDEVDMTIVLKDFTRDVFEIKSIPSTSVTAIKNLLNISHVKYYENKEKHDWGKILERIRLNPQSFVDEGCWQSVYLESSAAAALSSDSNSCKSEEFESDFEEEEFQWHKYFPKGGPHESEEESEASE